MYGMMTAAKKAPRSKPLFRLKAKNREMDTKTKWMIRHIWETGCIRTISSSICCLSDIGLGWVVGLLFLFCRTEKKMFWTFFHTLIYAIFKYCLRATKYERLQSCRISLIGYDSLYLLRSRITFNDPFSVVGRTCIGK